MSVRYSTLNKVEPAIPILIVALHLLTSFEYLRSVAGRTKRLGQQIKFQRHHLIIPGDMAGHFSRAMERQHVE